jgi:hypothetical protein
MPQQTNLTKTYIRVDSSGRDVAGSNVLRNSMPKNGKWKEVQAYACCNPFILLSHVPADTDLASTTFSLKCDGTDVTTVFKAGATTTLASVVAKLNAMASLYGRFSVNGTAIELRLKQEIGTTLCSGALSFTTTV